MSQVVFFGRIHPERYEWSISGFPPLIVNQGKHDEAEFVVSVSYSQVTVRVKTAADGPILNLKNQATDIAKLAVDSAGFVKAAGLDVEIISCLDASGQMHVFNTAFDGLRAGEGTERDNAENALLTRIVQKGINSVFVRHALMDLRLAIREPADTAFHCYRAIESIRQEYLSDNKSKDSAKKESWANLYSATGVDQAEVRWLQNFADGRRHGQTVGMSHGDRERALRIARLVLEQHVMAQNAE